MVRNALHVPSMDYNLVPQFVIRAGYVVVNDVPKICSEDPAVDDHCVSFDQSDLRVPLRSNVVLLCFHMIVPTERELHECEKVFKNSDSSEWKPHCQSWELNERSILGFEGSVSEPSRRTIHRVAFEK